MRPAALSRALACVAFCWRTEPQGPPGSAGPEGVRFADRRQFRVGEECRQIGGLIHRAKHGAAALARLQDEPAADRTGAKGRAVPGSEPPGASAPRPFHLSADVAAEVGGTQRPRSAAFSRSTSVGFGAADGRTSGGADRRRAFSSM